MIGELVFSNIVPEFGTITMIILTVSIISIVAITAKTKVIPRF
ncbi:MAG: PEFG-CTERM sorting domain-containing protein [Nitrosarchaeum sp.]|nr:PEFG-CTERM sorting domain-containing protein [Nitrosarchaeum sp.]